MTRPSPSLTPLQVRKAANLLQELECVIELTRIMNDTGRKLKLHIYACDGDGSMYGETEVPKEAAKGMVGLVRTFIEKELDALGIDMRIPGERK